MKPQKSYRIEASLGNLSYDESTVERHSEIMSMLGTIRESIVPGREILTSLLEEHRRDMKKLFASR